jgi:hypothetical protein
MLRHVHAFDRALALEAIGGRVRVVRGVVHGFALRKGGRITIVSTHVLTHRTRLRSVIDRRFARRQSTTLVVGSPHAKADGTRGRRLRGHDTALKSVRSPSAFHRRSPSPCGAPRARRLARTDARDAGYSGEEHRPGRTRVRIERKRYREPAECLVSWVQLPTNRQVGPRISVLAVRLPCARGFYDREKLSRRFVLLDRIAVPMLRTPLLRLRRRGCVHDPHVLEHHALDDSIALRFHRRPV